jgi:hypothetical protein
VLCVGVFDGIVDGFLAKTQNIFFNQARQRSKSAMYGDLYLNARV